MTCSAHSQFVLQNNDCAVIVQADLTEPDTVLHATPTQRMLDVTQPVGLLATAVGHHIGPDRHPQAVFTRYQTAFPAGSYLAITHAASDFVTEHSQKATALAAPQLTGFLRDRQQILTLFGDWELVDPGLVTTSQWHPEPGDHATADPRTDFCYAGVAHKH